MKTSQHRTSSGTPAASTMPVAGRRRVIVERLQPSIDAGRFPIKRSVGETITATVDMFVDGHEHITGVLKFRRVSPSTSGDQRWLEVPLTPVGNDGWTASFTVSELGTYEYTVEGWMDRFATWLHGLSAKHQAGQDVASELHEGALLAESAAGRLKAETEGTGRLKAAPTTAPTSEAASNEYVGAAFRRPDAATDSERLLEFADILRSEKPQLERVSAARQVEFRELMDGRPDRSASTTFEPALRVTVDPVRARYGAWYEMFPRSSTPDPTRSATFREAEARLPDIEAMGFDVLYLPPVHPIGRTHRKGRNNSLTSEPGDVGSPWAIGSHEGGHTAIEPGLGTLTDFDRFVETAAHLNLQIALDIAFQVSPDHPWVQEHPQWFRHRPDGSIKYAENPPKKYQDIYPLDFDTADWVSLWQALRDVFLFWIGHGVKIFRVDNPHTKSFRFWEWCIAEIKREHPDTIFLSEAFTRPKLKQYLAKAGFTQSYTYFTWRNSADELREYVTELTQSEVREYLRPNFFANTPDILHEYLQQGGRPAFEVRLVLAATLAASYGIYSGYELCENVPVRAGSEEYLDSEKYQIKVRDWNQSGHLRELIARVNDIRRGHPALQQNDTLKFHPTDNPALLWYSKSAGADRVFVVANTTPALLQHGFIEMPLAELDLPADAVYHVEDLLDGASYTWHGSWNYVRLDPAVRMAHIFVVKQ